ncbi:MAG: zinc ribbon domain-containing protein [Thermoplasmata archaeon]|nr:zinc ribbon domain-containing protein [Thermoplasmata archaeon]
MKCRSCGSENPEGKKFCGDCGKDLAEASAGREEEPGRKCSACGRSIDMETNACPYCGHWVKRSMF